ncbi:hypothetical protein T484DRAFT_1795691, partial [Baffinella frigidus]
LVSHQLHCSGVLAAVKISRAGFPTRVPLLDCANRYRVLAPAGGPPLPVGLGQDARSFVGALLSHLKMEPREF